MCKTSSRFLAVVVNIDRTVSNSLASDLFHGAFSVIWCLKADIGAPNCLEAGPSRGYVLFLVDVEADGTVRAKDLFEVLFGGLIRQVGDEETGHRRQLSSIKLVLGGGLAMIAGGAGRSCTLWGGSEKAVSHLLLAWKAGENKQRQINRHSKQRREEKERLNEGEAAYFLT